MLGKSILAFTMSALTGGVLAITTATRADLEAQVIPPVGVCVCTPVSGGGTPYPILDSCVGDLRSTVTCTANADGTCTVAGTLLYFVMPNTATTCALPTTANGVITWASGSNPPNTRRFDPTLNLAPPQVVSMVEACPVSAGTGPQLSVTTQVNYRVVTNQANCTCPANQGTSSHIACAAWSCDGT